MSDLNGSRKRKITEVEAAESAESNKRARKDPPVGSDDICTVCRKGTELLYCIGACRRAFHRACLGLAPEHSEHYYCEECTQDVERTCFICREASVRCEKCCLLTCGKYYHATCVRSNSLTKTGSEDGTFICPRHVCTVCREEGPKAGQPLLYCFDCCAAYHQSCQPDIDVLSAMYCVCAKCQRVKKSSKSDTSTPAPALPVTPVNTTAPVYNNPLDPRLPSYAPNLLQGMPVPAEPAPLAAPETAVDEGELSSGPTLSLPTDAAELDRLAATDEWDLLDLGYTEAQVKELKQRAPPPPSRGGFRGRGRGRGSFDGSRDSFRARNRSRERDMPRDLLASRSQYPRTPDRNRSPSPSRSRHSPSPLRSSHHSSRWSDRRSPSPPSRRRSPSPLRSSHSYRVRSPDRDKTRASPRTQYTAAPRYSPPPPSAPSRTPPPPPSHFPSAELSVSKVHQSTYLPLAAAPTLELTKHHKLISVMDMITVSGPKLEMPVHLELMSVVPVSVVKTIVSNNSIVKTIIKLTPRPGSEAQCENLLYYLHQSGKAELFTLTTRHKVFVFSNKEDFVSDATFKRDPVCLCAVGVYQTDLSFL